MTSRESRSGVGDGPLPTVPSPAAPAPAGNRTYSGGSTATANDQGNTTDDSSRTYSDPGTVTDNGVTHTWTYSDSFTHGTLGDSNSTTITTVTVNPDGSETTTELTNATENQYSKRVESSSYKDETTDASVADTTRTYVDQSTHSRQVTSGSNAHEVNGIWTTTSQRDETLTDVWTHSEKGTGPDWTSDSFSQTTSSLTDHRSATETTAQPTTYTATYEAGTNSISTSSSSNWGDGWTSNSSSESSSSSTDRRVESVAAGTGTITLTSDSHSSSKSHSDSQSSGADSSSSSVANSSSSDSFHSLTAAVLQGDGSTVLVNFTATADSKWDSANSSSSTWSGGSSWNNWSSGGTYHRQDTIGAAQEGIYAINVHEAGTSYSSSADASGSSSDSSDSSNDWTYQLGAPGATLGPGSWGSYFDGWAATASDWGDWFGDYVYATLQTVLTYVANPGGAFTTLVLDTATFLIDSGIMDGFFGFVDGLLDTLNPFEALWSVPDFGPQFGHTTAYAIGNVAGMVTGVAVGFVIGNVAAPGSGLVACGGVLQKAALLYTRVDTVAGVAAAGVHLLQGNFGLGDVLSLAPLAGYILKPLKGAHGCFVAGTAVVMAPLEEADFLTPALATAAAPQLAEESFLQVVPEEPAEWDEMLAALAAVAVPIGVAGYCWARRRAKGEEDGQDEPDAWESLAVDVPGADRADEQPEPGEEHDELQGGYGVAEPTARVPTTAVVPSIPVVKAEADCEPREEMVMRKGQQLGPRSPWQWAGAVWLIGFLALAGWGLMQAAPPSWPGARVAPMPAAATAPSQGPAACETPERPGLLELSRRARPVVTKPIEQVRVGERVVAENPDDDVDEEFDFDVDPATWQRLDLRAPKKTGSWADVTLLRPATWIAENGARVGGTVRISVPECGIDGEATVLAIGPCPPISRGDGRVVTGTYRHSAATTIDVHIGGLDRPIGTTPNHPFWSEDVGDFVRADELEPGEHLRTLSGTRKVVRIAARDGTEPVYNLEVHIDHVFHVGELGVLVHNSTPLRAKDYWNYYIREKATGRIFYHGMAGPNLDAKEVQSRHLRRGRFNPLTDELVPVKGKRTYGEARWMEHQRILKDQTHIGREVNADGSTNYRGNRQNGIQPKKVKQYEDYVNGLKKCP